MEYEMICDECKRKYHIVLKENEKIAKNATEERIDFEETKLEENNVLSKCPYCNHENKYSISELNKNWYILYTTQIINCYPNTELNKAKELLEDIKKGWLDFEVMIATPNMMAELGKLGRILGPKGLMPNPKTGTVTMDVAKAVQETKAGKVTYRTDKEGNVHLPIGRVSFDDAKLVENFNTIYDLIVRLKPTSAKGTYIKNIAVSSTMGPAIKVQTTK